METFDPGLDRHEWETEFAQLESDLHESPVEALPELADLVRRMLIERGFDLGSVSLDQKGPALEFSAAQAVAEQGGQAAAGDVADAIQKLLAIYDWIDSERRAP